MPSLLFSSCPLSPYRLLPIHPFSLPVRRKKICCSFFTPLSVSLTCSPSLSLLPPQSRSPLRPARATTISFESAHAPRLSASTLRSYQRFFRRHIAAAAAASRTPPTERAPCLYGCIGQSGYNCLHRLRLARRTCTMLAVFLPWLRKDLKHLQRYISSPPC